MRIFYKKIVLIVSIVFISFCLQSCKISYMAECKNVDWKCDQFSLDIPYEALLNENEKNSNELASLLFEEKKYNCFVDSEYTISIILLDDYQNFLMFNSSTYFVETDNYEIVKVDNKDYQYYIEVEVTGGYVYEQNILADCNNIIHFYGYER